MVAYDHNYAVFENLARNDAMQCVRQSLFVSDADVDDEGAFCQRWARGNAYGGDTVVVYWIGTGMRRLEVICCY